MKKLIIVSLLLMILSGCKKITIELIGDSEIQLEIGTSFIDPGAIVSDGPFKITGDVDVNELGSYLLTYTDINDKVSVQRTVYVVDTTPPEISLIDGVDMDINYNSEFIEPGYVLNDNYDTNTSIVITGTVDTTKFGQYSLIYTATDSSNNSTTVTRTVNVNRYADGVGNNIIVVPVENDSDSYIFKVDESSKTSLPSFQLLEVENNDNQAYIDVDPFRIAKMIDNIKTSFSSKVIPDDRGYNIAKVIQDADGNITVIGFVVHDVHNYPFISKIDANNNLTLSTSFYDIPLSIYKVTYNDSGYYIGIEYYDGEKTKISIVGIDKRGDIMFNKVLDNLGGIVKGRATVRLKSISCTEDSVSIFVGNYYHFGEDLVRNFTLQGVEQSEIDLSDYIIYDLAKVGPDTILSGWDRYSNSYYLFKYSRQDILPLLFLDNKRIDHLIKLSDDSFIGVGKEPNVDASKVTVVNVIHTNSEGVLLNSTSFEPSEGLSTNSMI
ncbi:DUF5011 domain-containing protein [Mycoplasmatota bacterium zrk1]